MNDSMKLIGYRRLRSLEDANEHARRAYRLVTEPHANGIACPKCGAELWDSNPMVALTSYPPQAHVHCPACDYCGYRVL